MKQLSSKRDAARGLERVDGERVELISPTTLSNGKGDATFGVSATSSKVEEPGFVTCECPRGDCRSGACRRVVSPEDIIRFSRKLTPEDTLKQHFMYLKRHKKYLK